MMRRQLPAFLTLTPILLFGVGPVLWLVAQRFVTVPAELFDELLSPAGVEALTNTVVTALGASFLALALGTPLSFLLFRTDMPGRGPLATLFTLPSAIPPFIWGMGWISLASPRAGYLNRLFGGELFDAYGRVGIAFVLGTAGMPLVLLAGKAALSRIDSALEEAARMSGASPLRAVLTATLPLALPQLVAGAGLVFLFAASAFGVPYILGASATPPTTVLTVRIVQLLQGGGHLHSAIGLSVVLLVVATCVLAINQWLGKRGRVSLLSGKGISVRPLALGRAKWPAFAIAAACGGITVLLPLAAVLLTSFQRTFGAELRFDQLTTAHWAQALGDEKTLSAAGWSLSLALTAGLIVAALGLLVAIVRQRGGGVARTTETLSVWPYAVPGTVIALALIVAFSRDIRFIFAERLAFVLALGDTLWLLVVAYTAKHLAYGTRYTTESLAQVDPSLAEAARMSGAGPARAFRDAVLPMLKPALLTAFLLTFLTCTTELTMSVLLVSPDRELLGTRLFTLMTYADPTAASVLACAFVLLVAGTLALMSMGRASTEKVR